MDGDEFLLRWHAQHPGATSLVFHDWADPEGENGYTRLAKIAAEAGPDGAALDLACGDGYLLQQIAAQPTAPRALCGVDMSPDELAAAARRLGDRATLHLARAESLPLPDQSLDVVTCHMAFMLMGQAEQVTTELARVLRPGGRFAAIIGAAGREGVWSLFLDALIAAEKRENTPPLRLGHPGVFSPEGLAALFPAPRWRALALRDHPLAVVDRPAGLFDRLALMYNFDLLSAAGQAALRADCLRDWAPLADKDGLVRAGMTVRLVIATRGD